MDLHKKVGYIYSGIKLLNDEQRKYQGYINNGESFMHCPNTVNEAEADMYFHGMIAGINHAIEMLCAESVAKEWEEANKDGKCFILQ